MDKAAQLEDTREAVALFSHEESLQAAIDDLLASGFDRAELSLLGTEETLSSTFGDRFKTSAELEDLEGVPRSCYCSVESLGDAQGGIIGGLVYVGAVAAAAAVVVSGGTLGAIVAACVLASGAAGAVGAYLANLIGDVRARHIAEHLEHGGLLLWVRTWTPDDEERATKILAKHSGKDVHVHGSRTAAHDRVGVNVRFGPRADIG
jgi:hypothetical protein